MSAHSLPLSAVIETAADHLPPAQPPLPAPAALSFAASPLCQSTAFHMVERDGRKRACPLCPPPCPDCKGQGYRITTQDGTRPACISCDGLGWLIPGRRRRHG